MSTKRTVSIGFCGLLLAGLAIGLHQAWAQKPSVKQAPNSESPHPFPRRVAAPPLLGGTGWLNTDKEVKLAELRGKFVLLDFWTYCCINCLHVLPEIKKLEQAYPNELVVIGVHSAKFKGEKETANIRDAVMRHEITHPVVNDANMTIWRRYGTRSWPTLVLIDPNGEVFWLANGEKKFEDLDQIMRQAIPYYEKKGQLDRTPKTFKLEASKQAALPLKYPGKILADEPSNRLFIADSNHNRIVVCTLDGKLLHTIGSGKIGKADGNFQTCSFDHPQGMALAGDQLYVADTENHAIRKIDLKLKKVLTVAKASEQGEPSRPRPQSSRNRLNSPWALHIHEDQIYIANAGTHQLWQMNLDGSDLGPFAGNGREDIADGPLLPSHPFQFGYASFAQPSGLASDGKHLYVADSEGSAIRRVDFAPKGVATTLVGKTGTLFDFGDTDGKGSAVRLQHPLGIAFYKGKLYITDTYNNKIKVIDPKTAECKTLVSKPFDEPAGISAAAGKLYVADTNNHTIRVIDLENNNRVTTLEIKGLKP